ncbi:hypothetical protein [Streptomyces sp. NPDC004721]
MVHVLRRLLSAEASDAVVAAAPAMALAEHGAHDDLPGRDGTYARPHRLSAGAVLS